MARLERTWILPKKGFYKVNVHGVYYEQPLPNGNQSGIGVVVRNQEGAILKMVSGTIPGLTQRANELWAMLVGLRSAFFEGKKFLILESDNEEACREWDDMRWFIDPNHARVIHQLEQRRTDPNGICEVYKVHAQRNGLARYLAEDGAANRTRLVVFRRFFGLVQELWRWDMGLGPVEEQFQEVEEEDVLEAGGEEVGGEVLLEEVGGEGLLEEVHQEEMEEIGGQEMEL